MKRWLRIVLIAVPLIVLIATGGFILWANNPLQPTAEALAALQSDSVVTVSNENGWMVFTPVGGEPRIGFIFYPGGRVDARAYAPQVRAIAAAGYLGVIVPMPLNLAFFDASAADRVRAAFPTISRWAIGGHSLGGAMAARYAESQPAAVEGLILWASFSDVDLSLLDLDAASIYGSLDAVALPQTVEMGRASLPTDTRFVLIEGGNHSQFGWYGLQPGDQAAGISGLEQQNQTVTATVEILQSMGDSNP
jgi:hypothetical protein